MMAGMDLYFYSENVMVASCRDSEALDSQPAYMQVVLAPISIPHDLSVGLGFRFPCT